LKKFCELFVATRQSESELSIALAAPNNPRFSSYGALSSLLVVDVH